MRLLLVVQAVVISFYRDRQTVIPSHTIYGVTALHVTHLLFGHLFMLQLGDLCVRTQVLTYVWHQHTLAQLHGWVWVRHLTIISQPYVWVWVWNLPYVYRFTTFIYGDVVRNVFWCKGGGVSLMLDFSDESNVYWWGRLWRRSNRYGWLVTLLKLRRYCL